MYRRILSIIILCGILLNFSACKKEGCMVPQSENFNPNAKIDDGSCQLWKNRFLGTYKGTWKCNQPTQKELNVTVSDETGDNVSLQLDFGDGLHVLRAKVNSKNSFKIEEQSFSNQKSNTIISGIGILNSNQTITFECKYTQDGIETDVCMFSGSK